VLQCKGREMAGWPLMLKGMAKSPKVAPTSSALTVPIRGGGCCIVGVTSKSNPLAHHSGTRHTPATSRRTASCTCTAVNVRPSSARSQVAGSTSSGPTGRRDRPTLAKPTTWPSASATVHRLAYLVLFA
jgi:hypothetical protein